MIVMTLRRSVNGDHKAAVPLLQAVARRGLRSSEADAVAASRRVANAQPSASHPRQFRHLLDANLRILGRIYPY
jgi:hypothetical protein